ncbi:MAG: hypothetical protein IT161_16495 [Bryobacterales bacterium]|nr:hypothetical protein [Bryobacterales bacterium]
MIEADRTRLRQWYGGPVSRLHPAFACVYLYRLSHYLYQRGHPYAARFVWHCNTYITGSDLPPMAEIGAGLVIPCPAGAAVAAKVGRNFTLMPGAGVGSEIGRYEDIGAGPGLPVLGDDVVMEPRSGVLGPIRVGHRARICAGATATADVPDGASVVGPLARFLKLEERK